MGETISLLDGAGLQRMLTRIAHEIAERNENSREVALIGVQQTGVPVARRLTAILERIWGHPVLAGTVDISMHRDDLHQRAAPKLHPTEIAFDITGRTVVLVDDVLFTGRTIRAAMDALADFGRPARIQLAVLVDRGHRELPIRADFVGKNLPTSPTERVRVELAELTGRDAVLLERK
jgi:pyrimidine operon attenuation protein/uracil phosphoribosyltransferase